MQDAQAREEQLTAEVHRLSALLHATREEADSAQAEAAAKWSKLQSETASAMQAAEDVKAHAHAHADRAVEKVKEAAQAAVDDAQGLLDDAQEQLMASTQALNAERAHAEVLMQQVEQLQAAKAAAAPRLLAKLVLQSR